ncbi:hypothetical protein GSU68_01415 [Rathayibacter sp. VKM Ac-2759]|uniref:hypothetical protein n=1 Tax=Rathayibacter sp. VKM Ac-2759 TaxID=2609252 RepID=UPI0013164645|nr:hypothetical protein [Rathayibacter sp. VKM Ac-2759]QHC65367.1 hypothetical protein GSU68_01415 [Rathayibacter sp. VKM Ac-2759]
MDALEPKLQNEFLEWVSQRLGVAVPRGHLARSSCSSRSKRAVAAAISAKDTSRYGAGGPVNCDHALHPGGMGRIRGFFRHPGDLGGNEASRPLAHDVVLDDRVLFDGS